MTPFEMKVCVHVHTGSPDCNSIADILSRIFMIQQIGPIKSAKTSLLWLTAFKRLLVLQ